MNRLTQKERAITAKWADANIEDIRAIHKSLFGGDKLL
jgi:hypothetical protein